MDRRKDPRTAAAVEGELLRRDPDGGRVLADAAIRTQIAGVAPLSEERLASVLLLSRYELEGCVPMTALAFSRRRLFLEATTAGAWLGPTQVALGFALMSRAGASALLFFSLTTAWLTGSTLGLTLPPRGSSAWLLGAALALAVVARVVLQLPSFVPSAVVLGLLAGAAAGSFAGAFIRNRAGTPFSTSRDGHGGRPRPLRRGRRLGINGDTISH